MEFQSVVSISFRGFFSLEVVFRQFLTSFEILFSWRRGRDIWDTSKNYYLLWDSDLPIELKPGERKNSENKEIKFRADNRNSD